MAAELREAHVQEVKNTRRTSKSNNSSYLSKGKNETLSFRFAL